MSPTQTKSILITGCSAEGIGAAMALVLARRGHHVFATARDTTKVPDALSSLANVTVLPLDVVDTQGGFAKPNSNAALNTLSETLRLELAPFGVSVVTILPGIIDSKLHVNDTAGFDMPPSSRYSAIRDIIASCARGDFIPKDSLSAEKFAELVMDDVMGTNRGGLVSRGPYAVMLRCIGQWAPTWAKDYLLSQNQGIKELSQELAQDKKST
ncbi:hypothetical protein VSDG_05685 [Cytospora chrysosperma]|uniref:NADPH-dependent 1-acyldihydroxyacetone phosphate reductase n=1 Tax=Cytospora chrysosperma TaxID=252740 RepID=A0A423VTD1_CYTCH|nr:hypothetical protein VSDG_05685 [Valsa sordida]